MQRRRRHIGGEVELNVAAMLDMAFQLLAFFILTYHPAPVEGCIAIRMPAPTPATKPGASTNNLVEPTLTESDALTSGLTLQIRANAQPNGSLSGICIAEQSPVGSLREFERRIAALATPETRFDLVLLTVSPVLDYETVLRIVEIISRQKLTPGSQTKMSIVETPLSEAIPQSPSGKAGAAP